MIYITRIRISNLGGFCQRGHERALPRGPPTSSSLTVQVVRVPCSGSPRQVEGDVGAAPDLGARRPCTHSDPDRGLRNLERLIEVSGSNALYSRLESEPEMGSSWRPFSPSVSFWPTYWCATQSI